MQKINQDLYPYAAQFYSTKYGNMHYIDEGKGEPLVMVHGNPVWSFSFRHLIAKFSQSHRCIAMDHLGFGLSDKPTGLDYKPQTLAEAFADLMDSLDLHNITLVVSDWGGPIAMSYAANNPERIKKLVVLNSWCWSVKGDKHFEKFSGFMGGLVGRFLIKQFNFFVKVVVKKAYYNKHKLTSETMKNYLVTSSVRNERKAMWVLPKQIIAASDWLEALEQDVKNKLHQKPTLLLWGMHDIAFRKQELQRWLSLFDDTQCFKLQAGHFPEDEVWEKVSHHLEKFLSAHAS